MRRDDDFLFDLCGFLSALCVLRLLGQEVAYVRPVGCTVILLN